MELRTDYSNDDIKYALDYNTPTTFAIDDIAGLVAEVAGANDEYNWWWIIQLKNGKFVLLSAWCDYTGWDCQSGITHEEQFDTALDCAKASPEKESYSGRNIRQNLLLQVQGEMAFGLYDSKYEKDRPLDE